jgi:hypothetical protein
MRYLTPTYPAFHRVLLVESGPRAVLEAAIPQLANVFTPQTAFDLVTCYTGNPSTLGPTATVWRTADHRSSAQRARLLEEIKASGATAVAIICSGHPIMTRWKWWLAWQLPVKVLIINENADCFWLDTAHLSNARRMALVRLGLSGEIAGRTLLRLALFPLGLAYLLTYASVVHTQRWFRLALKSHSTERS